LTTAFAGTLALASVAPNAWAGTNGQQIDFDAASGFRTNAHVVAVNVWGHRNTDWKWVRWPSPRPGTNNPWPNVRPSDGSRVWTRGWWWKGNVEVWYKTSDGYWHRVNAWIPQGDDRSYQHIWRDTVLVTPHGSMMWGRQTGDPINLGTYVSAYCYSLPDNPYGLYHRYEVDLGYYGMGPNSQGDPTIQWYGIGGTPSRLWPVGLGPMYPAAYRTWEFKGCGA
jgi:hypothetical protein